MGSPISPTVTNLFMENFKLKALSTSSHSPGHWKRYIDDNFLVIKSSPDRTLTTTLYRKPTHTNLYLQWDSHCTISAIYSVVSNLNHRARVVCSNPQLLQQEEHIH